MKSDEPGRSPLKPRLLVLAAAALFSTGGAAIKATSLTAWQVASLRSAVAVVALAVMLPRSRRRPTPAMLGVGLSYAATLILFVVATKLTTAADAIFLQDTAPLYVLLFAPLVLGERIIRADLWFMLALAIGLAFFFVGKEAPIGTAPNPFAGNLAAAASGLTWACTVMGLRWLGTKSADGAAIEPALLTGTVISALAALVPALPLGNIRPGDWLIIGYLGIFQIGLAYTCLSKGLPGVPAVEASLLLLLEPVLNPVWSWLVHGEEPGPWAVAGGAVILTATGVRAWWDARSGARDQGPGIST
jgi:drug/metabolite transporter (DMT)-like permease